MQCKKNNIINRKKIETTFHVEKIDYITFFIFFKKLLQEEFQVKKVSSKERCALSICISSIIMRQQQFSRMQKYSGQEKTTFP